MANTEKGARTDLKEAETRMPLYQAPVEDTQFILNDNLPENLEALSIDRVVYQPEIPI